MALTMTLLGNRGSTPCLTQRSLSLSLSQHNLKLCERISCISYLMSMWSLEIGDFFHHGYWLKFNAVNEMNSTSRALSVHPLCRHYHKEVITIGLCSQLRWEKNGLGTQNKVRLAFLFCPLCLCVSVCVCVCVCVCVYVCTGLVFIAIANILASQRRLHWPCVIR